MDGNSNQATRERTGLINKRKNFGSKATLSGAIMGAAQAAPIVM